MITILPNLFLKKNKAKFIFPLSIYAHVGAALLTLPLALIAYFFSLRQEFTLAAFFAISLALQWWVYKTKALKNSFYVNKSWLKKTHKITPAQLDKYMAFNFMGYGIMEIIAILLLVFASHPQDVVFFFFFFYFIGFGVLRFTLYKLGLLTIPRGFEDVNITPYKRKRTFHKVDVAYQTATGYARLIED